MTSLQSLTKFMETARTAGCPKDQIRNFLAAGYVPQPKQLAFHALARSCDQVAGPTEVAFGGARGPGKSHSLLAQIALDDCQRVPGLKFLLLRRVGKAVRESFEDLRGKVVARVLHKYNIGTGVLKFSNGSSIVLGHFKDESDVDNYLGLEYDGIGVEEAPTLSQLKYKIIRTCCRTSKPNWRPRVYLNGNPGGVGHGWFKRRFITEPGQPRFVAATYRDNAFLNEGYVETLNDLSGWMRRAWRDGDWDILAGQYYSNWRPDTHVIEPFELLHAEYTWFMAIDYGFGHPTTALVFAMSNDQTLYVVAEHGASKRLPQWHSREMLAMLNRCGLQRDWLLETLVGSDAWRRKADGVSAAEEYERLGWQLSPAIMSRVAGAFEVLRRLGDPDPAPGCLAIAPSLFIFNTCPRLIAQLPEMQHDPRRPEDVLKVNVDEDGEGGDDFYDTLRYGVMSQQPAGTVEMGPGLQWQRR